MKIPRSTRALASALQALLLFLLAGTTAFAQTPATPTPPPPESWAGQLATLGRWVADQQHSACTEHCFVLQRLVLTGSARTGHLGFELEGSVLASSPVAVPLFGPANQVQLSDVTENGQPAAVGFEQGHYFLFTGSRRFVVRGALTLRNDRALLIPGPLNLLEARLAEGTLAEGAQLAGLTDTTVHLEDGEAHPAPEPTVFRLARAVRVGRELQFEYHLSLRSGAELGVVRLPLRNGERVLEVTPAQGWRVEGDTLLVPTAGRTAELTITGTQQRLNTFAPDERSSDEWWLLESDEEHRLQVETTAARMDPSRSPIARTQNSGRLYLVRRGQQLQVSSQSLAALEVLAAVLRSHDRTMVLTRNGDLVSEDTFFYENNGIEHLQVQPHARPIYLETDGVAERILRGEQQDTVLVPLRVGGHRARLQTMTNAGLSWWGGRMELPLSTTPLTTSRVNLTLGLPSHVHPLLVTGCERTWLAFGLYELVGVLLSGVLAWMLVRTSLRRLCVATVLSGLWLLAPTAFALLVPVALGVRAALGLRGVFRGAFGYVAPLACVLLGFGAALPSAFFAHLAEPSTSSATTLPSTTVRIEELQTNTRESDFRRGRADNNESNSNPARNFVTQLGNAYQRATDGDGTRDALTVDGTVQGTTPVALPLPRWQRTLTLSRELVTAQRPFRPTLYYVTGLFLLPLYFFWFASVLALGWLLRPEVSLLLLEVRERLDAARAEEEDEEESGETPAKEVSTEAV